MKTIKQEYLKILNHYRELKKTYKANERKYFKGEMTYQEAFGSLDYGYWYERYRAWHIAYSLVKGSLRSKIEKPKRNFISEEKVINALLEIQSLTERELKIRSLNLKNEVMGVSHEER